MNISLCITNYNRLEMVIESFTKVYNDKRITEIVISDDYSDPKIFNDLMSFIETAQLEKVKLFRNNTNMGMSVNKQLAIKRATNEWCIIFDSDNIIDRTYLDALYEIDGWEPNIIYCPSFAKPQFDYSQFEAILLNSITIKDVLKYPMGACLVNTCNYVVNRKEYLRTFKYNPLMKGTDTIWFNYNWLKKGNSFVVVPNMVYEHLDHPGSGFRQDLDYNMAKSHEIKNLILEL